MESCLKNIVTTPVKYDNHNNVNVILNSDSEKYNISDIPHQNSNLEKVLHISNHDIDSCLENIMDTSVKHYSDDGNIMQNSDSEKCNIIPDVLHQNSNLEKLLHISNHDIDSYLGNIMHTPVMHYSDDGNIVLNSDSGKILNINNHMESCSKNKVATLMKHSNTIYQNTDSNYNIILNADQDSTRKEFNSSNTLIATKSSVASVTNDFNKDNVDNNDNVDDDDDDSVFIPSLQDEESTDSDFISDFENEELNEVMNGSNESNNSKNNESSEIIYFDKSENNSSLQNESVLNCSNVSTRKYKLSKTQSKISLKKDFVRSKVTNYYKTEDLFVEMSQGRKGDKKSNFCVYCNTMQTKIARHLELKHSKEEAVIKFLLLPKGSHERKTMIGNIRKKGNFEFNTNADLNNGFMNVVRRPNNRTMQNGSNFLPCPKCKGFYTKRNLRHHFRYCTNKKDTSRSVLHLARSTAKSAHNRASVKLRTRIIPILRQDVIRDLIRFDLLLILYGNYLCKRHRLQHQDDYIRSQLRLLARYLLILKEIEPDIKELKMLFDPKYFDIAIKAVNIIANKYDEKTETYGVSFNALSLGTMLKKLCQVLITKYIMEHNSKKQKLVEDFKKILDSEYGYVVNKTVLETQSKQNRQKKVELPLSSDIIKFNEYLENKRISETEILKDHFSHTAWRSLAEVTLIIIQLFNRRRAGEIERAFINDYKNSMRVTDKDEEYKKLRVSEKERVKEYIRFTIRGKLNRTVPVLLKQNMIESIEIILNYRKMAGVSSKNPYIFGLQSHHPNIHKQFYRQPVAKVDIFDMSKILERAGNTSVQNSTDSITKNNLTDTTDTSATTLNETQRKENIFSNSNQNDTIENKDSENNIISSSINSSNENTLKQTRKRTKKRKYSDNILSTSDGSLKKTRLNPMYIVI
ncbi:hypothetical protein ALC62_08645 [Cyphomyrmex costatus]|uniref:Uncharacterized protein n=1 Tax=Cyphomyrmex costatus TaxID=456900 RepID=A0A151IGH4_9HYME|nr:hypothetical protein ALC62_08645 [Cyphomyrmex costatus]